MGDKISGKMDRTTQRSYLRIAPGYVPDNLQPTGFRWPAYTSRLFGNGGVQIGPIPTGHPD